MTLRRRSFFLQPCTILRCTKGSNGGTLGKANFPIRTCATRWCREPRPTFVPNAHVPPRSSVRKELRRKFAGSQACRMRRQRLPRFRQRVARQVGRPSAANANLDGKPGDKNFTWVAEKFLWRLAQLGGMVDIRYAPRPRFWPNPRARKMVTSRPLCLEV